MLFFINNIFSYLNPRVNISLAGDSICTPLAMQCLSGYALSHSFIDPAYSTTMNMAYQEINQHRRSLSRSLEIAQQHNLRFNFDRTLEQARIEELREHIHKIEDNA